MARKKRRQEQQYKTQAVGEEALDRGVRGIDIKPIASDADEQESREDHRRRHRTGRRGGSVGDEGEDGGC
ncbi:MAG: hypothetical protein JXR83_12300 [Deltaproteobacteria bacterium]|nr:hypothetical protein [Deltaproteobacteria bacterium]